MSRLKSGLLVSLIVICLSNLILNASTWDSPVGSTNSWFNTSYWIYPAGILPQPADTAYIRGGTCLLDGESDVVVNRLESSNQGDMNLDIEAGSTLSVSNYCRIGTTGSDGTINVRGNLNILNVVNDGFIIGGYSNSHTNYTSKLRIDGGNVTYGTNLYAWYPVQVGTSTTGIVEIVNGGQMYIASRLDLAGGKTEYSNGQLLLYDGIVTNLGSLQIANYGGEGKMVINNGGFYSMSGNGSPCMYISRGGSTGSFELNGGEFIGRHAFNHESENAQRSVVQVVGGDDSFGTFVQNGGYVEVVGLTLGEDGGKGVAIISNGLFNAMSNKGSWSCFKIYDNCKLTIAGGEFHCYTNSTGGYVQEGGTLEFIDGSLTTCSKQGFTLFSFSNSTIRVIGSKCDIDVGWWRFNSGEPHKSILELILTQDEGHISTIKSLYTVNDTALPGFLHVGFAGGACLLSTNYFVCIKAGRYLSTSYVDPTAYGLDLWNSDRTAKYRDDEFYIELKDSASKGSVSLPRSTYSSFSASAYGYVDVDGLTLGTLPELTVEMTMQTYAKTLDEIAADLRSAGYTNSVVKDSSTIEMKIPAEKISADNQIFAWDFREFDGTVNAKVSAVAFNFNPGGSVIIIK